MVKKTLKKTVKLPSKPLDEALGYALSCQGSSFLVQLIQWNTVLETAWFNLLLKLKRFK